MEEVIKNKSTVYITPMLGDSYKQFLNLKGCFIGDESRPDLNNHIFLLVKYEHSEYFLEYEESLMQKSNFVEKYDPDNYSVMFVYKVPSKFQSSYDAFKKSKYSELDSTYKRIVVLFWEMLVDSIYFRIMYKDPQLLKELEESLGCTLPEDVEVSSTLNLKKEIYNDTHKIKRKLKEGIK